MVIVSGNMARSPYDADRNKIVIIRKTTTNADSRLFNMPSTIACCHTTLMKVLPAQRISTPSGKGCSRT